MTPYSVTTVLSDYAGFHRIDPDVLASACRRGTMVHAACEAIANGIPVFGVPDALRGYVDSFRQWFIDYVLRVFYVETRFHCPTYCFHGKPDLVAMLVDGRTMIVDVKTPVGEGATWRLQMAGYKHLVGLVMPINGAMSLRLPADGGTAKANVYDPDESGRDFAAFLSALNVYRYING